MTWLTALALSVLPLAARAADEDLPARVGRIAQFAGQLVLSPQDRPTDWEPIGINYPITSGDNLWVSGDGRAEIDYGGGQFRMAGDTSVHVSRLDDRQLALFVAQGRVVVRVRSLDPGDVTHVDTPNTQVTLTRPGLYRIDVVPDRETTTLTVREGEAQVALANGAQQSLPGQTVSVVGTDPANADIRNSIGVDGFDTWSADRDRYYERGRSTAFVSREMVGYADLDAYGSWQTYPEYGAVWFPTAVASNWAPYRDGYWTDVAGWGPTWVDRQPWGYAPFHYGRWAWVGGRWGWCPGGYVARPIWAPALVAWFGGPGWGVSVGRGGPVYGWVPLGWGDAYHPNWRRCSYNCWARYNRPYGVNVAVRPDAPQARYRNTVVPGALSAVAAPALVGRRPVGTNLVDVPVSLATSAPVMGSAPPVAHGSRRPPNAGGGDAVPPPGASAHVRAPRPDRSGPGVASRPALASPGPTPSTVPAQSPSTPGVSGALAPAAPVQRETGRGQPQAARTRDQATPSTAPQPASGSAQVPAQSSEAARQARRDPTRYRENTVPAGVSQTAPVNAVPSPSGAPRPPPYVAPPVRAAPAVAPGLSGQAGSAASATAAPLVMPSPHATGQAAPAASANARSGRAPEKSVPDAPAPGTVK